MKRIAGLTLVVMVVCMTIGLVGCEKTGEGKYEVDLNKPVAEIKAAVEKMDVEQIKEVAAKYTEALQDKKVDVDALVAKLKEIPMTEMLGEKAKSIKTEMDELTKSLKALQERLDVYVTKLKELKVDVSEFKI